MELQAGRIAHVRSRPYLIEEVVPPPAPGQDTLVRLSCLADDAQGDPLEVLWEREVDARLMGASTWEAVAQRGFDDPKLFSAYLHTLRWNCVTSTDPKLFQAPYRAGIEVRAFQLEPLRKALLMPRVNLFIADDVGLGKTIEAGLILREMLMRQRVRRVVICCPPSVVRQWKDEMEQRFGLTFVVYDSEFVAQRRQERGYGVNPWKTHNRFIISHNRVRDENYAADLRGWLDDFAPGSMLILDEAHNAAPASGSKYAIDSRFTKTMRDLAPRFEHRLFLSATPHNGHSNSFAALMEILDPQRFLRGVPVDHKLRDEVMVRRLKKDLRAFEGGFPERRVIPVSLGGLPDDAPELVLSYKLQGYRRAREARMKEASKSKRNTAALVMVNLQKRLLSSIEAFHRTLRVHTDAVQRQVAEAAANPPAAVAKKSKPETSRNLSLLQESVGSDDDRAELPEDQVEKEEDAQVSAATRKSAYGTPSPREVELLSEMRDLTQRYRFQADPRIGWLRGWIKEHLCPEAGTAGAKWLDRRVLIFTEYTDTKRYLEQQLRQVIAGSELESERVKTFHGGIGEDSREAIKHAFNLDPAKHPLRILIATDAAREGVNLQNHCADLVHFDVPWNPSRMEQRNGRIDRKLQRADVVHCYYFVLPQRAEDRVLEVLVEKTRRIHEELGSLSPVLERNLNTLMRQGIQHADADRITDGIRKADDDPRHRDIAAELESTRRHDALAKELENLQGMLASSQEWLGLSDEHFRNALSASLALMNAEPMTPADAAKAVEDPSTARWFLPALDERDGADPTWTTTLDTLRPPRGRKQKLRDWRRETAIRPIVFRDPGTLDGDVVHLHLEHRVVQRLLGRFLAQGFLRDDLTRACVVLTDDPEPKVIALGRLSLYGRGAARLHDEIVAVAADWSDPATRGRSKLKALTQGDKKEVLGLLERSLATPRLMKVPDAIHARLRAEAERDVSELIPHLDRRAADLTERAVRDLGKRAEKEAVAMVAILEAQRKRIRERQKELEDPQQSFGFDRAAMRQLNADRRKWGERLTLIDAEVTEEPARIRAAYEVKATRVEPAGLVYLWPVSG